MPMPLPVNTSICHDCINLIKNSNEAFPAHIAKWLSNQRGKANVAPELLKIAIDNGIPMLFETGCWLHQIRIYLKLKTNPNETVNISKEIKKSPIYKWIESLLPKDKTKADVYIDHINECIEYLESKLEVPNHVLTNIYNIKVNIKRYPTKFTNVITHAENISKHHNVINPLLSNHIHKPRERIIDKLKQCAIHLSNFHSLPTNKEFITFRRSFITAYGKTPIHKYTTTLEELGLTKYFTNTTRSNSQRITTNRE